MPKIMAKDTLEKKIAYFKQHDLFDISDDEDASPDPHLAQIEHLFDGMDAMPPPPPKLVRRPSSFLGQTPKEIQAEFNAHTGKRRAVKRAQVQNIDSSNSTTAPASASAVPISALSTTPRIPDQDEVPFYKRFGPACIPRELKMGKNVKLANDIKLEPESKQLFKNKIIYFYPNDDISSARRQRIHKIIQLGAAWAKHWHRDITHIMVDDGSNTYPQLLKHLNVAGLPRKVVLVKFDPYVPQCIQFNTVLEPTANRFLVKGAPRPQTNTNIMVSNSGSAPLSKVPKPSVIPATPVQGSQSTKSFSKEDEAPSNPTQDDPKRVEEVVKDSFRTSPEPAELSDDATHYNDALSQAIRETKAIAHLPLDDDEDDQTLQSNSGDDQSGPDTDDESPQLKHKAIRNEVTLTTTAVSPSKSTKRSKFDKSNFQCMNPERTNASDSQNANLRTIQILEEMGRHYDQMNDNWRTLAYRRAVTTLRKQTGTKISTKEQAFALPFIGSRLAEKIEEIVLTDRLRRLDSTKEDPLDKTLRLFLGIYGAGLSQAHKWVQAGHRTLSDLMTSAHLTPSQKIGIERYTDFATRIPRDEVAAHGTFVRNELHKIDPGFDVHSMGSYRRGAKDSGDIDLIITKPNTSLSTLRTVVFEQLVPRLYSLDFLKVSLATSRRHNDGTKWHGASCLPDSTTWRRLDLLLVPEEEFGAAMIYFTGNDIFNRSVRLLASKMGMRLNQKGLYKNVMRGKDRQKITEGTLVEGRSERRIFEILGVPWREPGERIC